MYPDAPATSTRIRLDCFVSWGTCANLSLVYRGNRGPLDTASGLLVALNRAVVRSRAAGRARSGGQSVLPTELPPLLSSLFSYCVSLPPSFRPAGVVRQSNNWYRRSRSQSFPAPRKEGRGRMVGGRTSAESGWYTGRASKRVRCLPLLPLIIVASLPLHLSFHDERSERRSGGKNR